MHGFTPSLRIFLVVTAAVFISVEGNFQGFLCPDKTKCEVDCRANHNAAHGFCGNEAEKDYNCYCSLPRPKKARMPPEIKKQHIQCKDPMEGKFDVACRIDCQCVHAALDGKCNYKTEACECIGGNPKPKQNGPCPYSTSEEAYDAINNMQVPGFPKFPVMD